jgi:uncharacterized protein
MKGRVRARWVEARRPPRSSPRAPSPATARRRALRIQPIPVASVTRTVEGYKARRFDARFRPDPAAAEHSELDDVGVDRGPAAVARDRDASATASSSVVRRDTVVRSGRVRKEPSMGQPVVHFEVIGRDAGKLQSYYSELFGWQIDTNNPVNYGVIDREANLSPDGVGIGGGVAAGPEGYPGHVTFYVAVPEVEAALAKAESLGGRRVMGPEAPMEGIELGLFTDPEGHLIGVVKAMS